MFFRGLELHSVLLLSFLVRGDCCWWILAFHSCESCVDGGLLFGGKAFLLRLQFLHLLPIARLEQS